MSIQGISAATMGQGRVGQQEEASKTKGEEAQEKRDAQMRKVAQDFEEIFTRQMLGQMNKTTGSEQSGATKMYNDMYQEQIAKLGSMSEGGKGGLGIARLLMKQWGLE